VRKLVIGRAFRSRDPLDPSGLRVTVLFSDPTGKSAENLSGPLSKKISCLF